jgi:DNA-binding MarR family transcriptional regulator
VLRQFRQVFSAVRNHFHQLEKLAGVGGAQVWAMSEIRQAPGMSMNSLARAMDVHQSTASNLVRQLVQKELVRTEKSSLDRRGVCLYLEPAAEALLCKVPGPHQGLLPQALSQMSPQALQQLSVGLGALVGGLAVDEAAARTPLASL